MRALKITGKVLLVIASIILCVALFVSTLATMLVADVKVATNKDNLQNLIRQTLSAPAQQTTLRPMALAAGAGAELNLSNGDISGALVEFAYDTLKEAAGDELDITLEQVEEFVEESSMKDFIADKSAGIINDIYTGENTTTISTDELLELVKENKELIKKQFDLDFTDDKLDELKVKLEEVPVLQQIQEEGAAAVIMSSGAVAPGEESAGNPLAQALELVRFYTSDTMLWLLIGVCAMLIGLLFLCAWSKPHKAMLQSGITLLVAGSIFLIPTLIAWLAPATWMGVFSFEPLLGTVSRFILMLTGGVCGAVAGLGVALIAGGIVVKVLMKKKAAVMAAEAAPVAEIPAEEAAAVEEVPAEETPVEEAPAEEAPAEEAPAEEAPAEEPAAEETV